MDRVFSVDEIADQFWSPHPPIPLDGGGDDDDDQPSSSSAATTAQSKMMQGMNRSSSEWAFQRFLQEAAPDRNPQPLLSSSSSTHPPQNDDVVEIKGSRVGINGNKQHPSNTAGPPPPNIPVDSDAYQAYLKSRLELACAAVALTRASNVKGQASTATAPDNGSQASNSSLLVHQGAKYYTSTPFKVLA